MPKHALDHRASRGHCRKKHGKKRFSEDAELTRRARVSFKNYLRELDESFLEAELSEGDRPLTARDEKLIIQDFTRWSGGVSPEDCELEMLQDYSYGAAPKDLDQEAVLSFLVNRAGE